MLTAAVPGEAMSAADKLAVRTSVGIPEKTAENMNVVGRGLPFHNTTEALFRFPPAT